MSTGTWPALTWTRVKFDTTGVATLPNDKQGIYPFFAESEIAGHKAVRDLLYVGETHAQSLRSRVRSYLKEKDKPHVPTHQWRDQLPHLHWADYDEVIANVAGTITGVLNASKPKVEALARILLADGFISGRVVFSVLGVPWKGGDRTRDWIPDEDF